MKVLYVEVGKRPEVIEIDGNLDELQRLVGGYVEQVVLDEESSILCDEDGYRKESPTNRIILHNGKYVCELVGNFLIVGTNEIEICSLSDSQLETYKESFKYYTVRL